MSWLDGTYRCRSLLSESRMSWHHLDEKKSLPLPYGEYLVQGYYSRSVDAGGQRRTTAIRKSNKDNPQLKFPDLLCSRCQHECTLASLSTRYHEINSEYAYLNSILVSSSELSREHKENSSKQKEPLNSFRSKSLSMSLSLYSRLEASIVGNHYSKMEVGCVIFLGYLDCQRFSQAIDFMKCHLLGQYYFSYQNRSDPIVALQELQYGKLLGYFGVQLQEAFHYIRHAHQCLSVAYGERHSLAMAAKSMLHDMTQG